MLTASTVSICRDALRKELIDVEKDIESYNSGIRFVASQEAFRKAEQRTMYLRLWEKRNKLRIRRARIENAIRDLKANLSTGKSCTNESSHLLYFSGFASF